MTTTNFSYFSYEIAARTVWMEARGEGDDGIRAVAHVLINRLYTEKWGVKLSLVCLSPLQFSCWNTNDPNRKEMCIIEDDDPTLSKCREFIAAAIDGEADPTGGATHYYADYIEAPSWAKSAILTVKIGHQMFYKDVS